MRTSLGRGAVDGFNHDAAAPELLEACLVLRECAVREAETTPGFELPAPG